MGTRTRLGQAITHPAVIAAPPVVLAVGALLAGGARVAGLITGDWLALVNGLRAAHHTSAHIPTYLAGVPAGLLLGLTSWSGLKEVVEEHQVIAPALGTTPSPASWPQQTLPVLIPFWLHLTWLGPALVRALGGGAPAAGRGPITGWRRS